MKRIFACLGISILLLQFFVAASFTSIPPNLPLKLSDYQFFEGDISAMQPCEGVIPYDLNMPLFSDYTEKLRFVKLPDGESVSYNDSVVLDFPIGTILIKTFYYYKDARNPSKGRQLLETRLLVHEKDTWQAYSYVWNDEQTDAFLEMAGEQKQVTWRNEKGKKQKINYLIPNINQCKGCHNRNEKMTPIGPSIRQLNGDFTYKEEKRNQLLQWQSWNILKDLPSELEEIPRFPVWANPESGDIESRARAYLDINCAHCHSHSGPARTSGLYLNYDEQSPTAMGIDKPPVAAGRGSGDRNYTIVAGNPDASIMVYRIESKDVGIRMPEISRQLVHKEGVALIRAWIKELDQ